jgi:hypothetical protein
MFRALLVHPQEALYKTAIGMLRACYVSWLHSKPDAANCHNTHAIYQVQFGKYLLRMKN